MFLRRHPASLAHPFPFVNWDRPMDRLILAYLKSVGPQSPSDIAAAFDVAVEDVEIPLAGALVGNGLVRRDEQGYAITPAGVASLDVSANASGLASSDQAVIDAAFQDVVRPGASFLSDVLAAGFGPADAAALGSGYLEFAVRASTRTGDVGILKSAFRGARLAGALRHGLEVVSSAEA